MQDGPQCSSMDTLVASVGSGSHISNVVAFASAVSDDGPATEPLQRLADISGRRRSNQERDFHRMPNA
eukprot:15444803-Alexandrium_andersonii.AAC.1